MICVKHSGEKAQVSFVKGRIFGLLVGDHSRACHAERSEASAVAMQASLAHEMLRCAQHDTGLVSVWKNLSL